MRILTVLIGKNEEENLGFVLNYIAAKVKNGSTESKRFPTKWKIEQEKENHTIFVMFETDLHKTKSSRVFLGAFESLDLALQNAQDNNCIRSDCKVDIIETELNNFKEL